MHSYIVWVPFYVLVKVFKDLIILGESVLWINFLGNVSIATENYFQNEYNKSIFNIVIIYCIY